ncbi:MAG: MBOAT family protein, partial [Candidatus Latescibacterota bacterium]
MLFNSLEFAAFLPTVFLLYWFVLNRSVRGQNLFILVASYVFYGWWDWRFLALIIVSSTVDYAVGLRLPSATGKVDRRILLGCSLLVNLGMLGFFKYFDFFAASLAEALGAIGIVISPFTLNVVLPVGISFYTFQTLSYTIDVYRRKIEPTRDWIAFFAFVAFFPQLVAGPIERASNLLPQFLRERRFDTEKAIDGVRQMVWGLFKKMVVADTCGFYADRIFADYQSLGAPTLLLGAIYFSMQIYGDFSGYSDIAI